MKTWTYNVLPHLPERLAPLRRIAYNLWYSWTWEASELFMRLGLDYWEHANQNPVRVLGIVPQTRFEEILEDDSFLAAMDRVYESFQAYLNAETWFDKHVDSGQGAPKESVAYFSCEYGLDQGLPVYSGGLGVLAGDHLKSASDLGIPLVAVGLLYREGYFRQHLNAAGDQQEEYPENDWHTMPVTPITDAQGRPLKITVDFPDALIHAQVWRVQVGRVSLFLLDSNIPDNAPAEREVTSQLYGGDREMRIRQEILLGVGGLRALWAMGLEPTVCHINEGHSAFLVFERIARYMETQKVTFEEARLLVWSSNVFTTHTPVSAGNERFDPGLVQRYLAPHLPRLGIGWDECFDLGREILDDGAHVFCMTVLALKLSAHCNAVAKLHGTTSRKMWSNLWPTVPDGEIPIGHVTNGIHTHSWISHDIRALFLRYLGPRFIEDPTAFDLFERINEIPASELWRNHERRRERLVAFVRQRTMDRLSQRGRPPWEIALARELLDPEALTIGFARRFATYKRGTLLFSDPDRLSALLNDPDRPVQLIFAGKSHPHDLPGKALIREIVEYSKDERFRGKIVFVEDYDIAVARYLTRGCDVWLNTPRRPLEASGTSGMKAALNGALNISTLDGWWDEAYSADVGWAIGDRGSYNEPDEQDAVDSRELYNLLQRQVVPLFYDRSRDGLPRGWIEMMKASMSMLGAFFNTGRMLEAYTRQYYLPAWRKGRDLAVDEMARTRDLVRWTEKLHRQWPQISIGAVKSSAEETTVGSRLSVQARVNLSGLNPNDVSVELYYGAVDNSGVLAKGQAQVMTPGVSTSGEVNYVGDIPCERSGRFGFAVRVLPRHDDLCHPYMPGVIRWAE